MPNDEGGGGFLPELLVLDEGNDSDEITADPQQGEDKSSNGSKKGQGGGEVDSSWKTVIFLITWVRW